MRCDSEEFSVKLDEVMGAVCELREQLGQALSQSVRFRPDALWTLDEAAKELRMSTRTLLKHVSLKNIKPWPRKFGGGGRGKRGERILFLYEEIQRFKGVR